MQNFSQRLIDWQQSHGRHTLPWQNTRDPYAVWISEIMLQQTQVSAVIPYYKRFMTRFPDIAALAGADEEEVLQHWSGLGYYSRARNLHRAASIMAERHGGQFPRDIEAIQALPGIGRSTAAAIAAFAFGQRRAILDGNVKRVFARVFGIDGWPGQPAIEKRMWVLADELLPQQDIEIYTQGLMDLGATLCTRTKPDCGRCPMQGACVADKQNLTAQLPAPKPRKALPEKQIVMLMLLNGNEILLEKRPSTGIWGGLWSLPEAAVDDDLGHFVQQRFGITAQALPPLQTLTHTFTHFRLHIIPQPLLVMGRATVSAPGFIWLDRESAIDAALPTPVRTLLRRPI